MQCEGRGTYWCRRGVYVRVHKCKTLPTCTAVVHVVVSAGPQAPESFDGRSWSCE